MTPTDPLEAAQEEAVERIRSHHDRTRGHRLTNKVGYCAEPDGISATYCETGILLAALAPPRPAGVDVERLAAAMNNVLTWHMGYQPGQEAGKLAREYAALTPDPDSEPVEPTDDDLRDSLQKFVDASSPVSEPVEPAIDRVYWDSAVDISGMKRVGDPPSEPVDGLPNRGQRICPFCDGAGVVGKEDNQ